jgi:phage tail protein X
MGRYTHTNIKRNSLKNRVFKTTLYPKIPILDSDIFTMSKKGDRLDLLAFKYYGDTSLWWIIALANDIDDANFTLKSGLDIRIPTDTAQIFSDLEELNRGF